MWEFDKRLMAAALVILLVAFGLGSFYGSYRESQSIAHDIDVAETLPQDQGGSSEEHQEVVVYVTGEVEYPNVYSFPAGARVCQALEKAVPKPTADMRHLDMARVMADEETILVPAVGEQWEPGVSVSLSTGISASGKVNINRASAAELDQHLSGIGPTLAQRIIDYREANGPFRKIEDLCNVSGIGEKRFADIKDQIDVK